MRSTVTSSPDAYAHAAVGGLPVITWPALQAPGLDAFVTTTAGGVSSGPYSSLNLGLHVGDREVDVLGNREQVAAALGTTLDNLVFGEQVHGRAVQVVTAEHRGRSTRSLADVLPGADALVTAVPGVVLVVMVADCVPLVLHDPVAGVLACVHAGWGGTVRGVTTAAVETMVALGSRPADVDVGIGPAIYPERYQVGADVVGQAEAAFGARTSEVIRPDGTGRWTFDLWRANTIQLVEAGVAEIAIHLAALDTARAEFFTHRSDGPCGRFAAVARLRAEM